MDQWNYIVTSDNPAAADTRGLSADALKYGSWFNGPEFLRTRDFPFQVDNNVLQSIKKKKVEQQVFAFVATSKVSKALFNWSKFTGYSKIPRIMAYILLLLPKHRHFCTQQQITDALELNLSERKLLLLSQKESFSEEYK